MIIRNKKDILNPNYSISEHPDNTELESWLSWLPTSTYYASSNVVDIEYKLNKLKLKLKILRGRIFLSLNKDDYATLKVKKTVVESREDVRELIKEIEKIEYDLNIADKILKKRFQNRSRLVSKFAKNRAATSNYEENIEWTIRQQRRGG